MNTTDLTTASGQIWTNLTLDSVSGLGRVRPRLSFVLRARASRENIRIQIAQLRSRLMFDGELLGTGTFGEAGEEGWVQLVSGNAGGCGREPGAYVP